MIVILVTFQPRLTVWRRVRMADDATLTSEIRTVRRSSWPHAGVETPEPGDQPITAADDRQQGARNRDPPPFLGSELKTISVLIADLANSTGLVDGLSPEQADLALMPATDAMVKAVEANGGSVANLRGDGLTAFFGAPKAHEDHAIQACLAALDILAALRAIPTPGFRARIGLHAGDVLVRSIATSLSQIYDASGVTVHIAAKLEQLAEPDTLWTTAEIWHQVEDRFNGRCFGRHEIPGVTGSFELYEITGARRHRSRWSGRSAVELTRFVGRIDQMQRLRLRQDRARHGNGGFVVLQGEPGIGKTRIVHEFLVEVGVLSATYQAAMASYDASAPYLLLARLFRSVLALPEAASERRVRLSAFGFLKTQSLDSDAFMPLLLSVLGFKCGDKKWDALDPTDRKEAIEARTVELITAIARQKSAIIFIDDLQWADAASGQVLRLLATQAPDNSLLVLTTCRSDEIPDWLSESCAEFIDVSPLDAKLARQMAAALVGLRPDQTALSEHVVRRADGVPLFIEEMAHAVVEQTPPRIEDPNPPEHRSDLASLPRTVQAVVAARIDRLHTRDKDTLQLAAIIGERFDVPLLRKVSRESRAKLDQALKVLLARKFVVSAECDDLTDRYMFRHATIQTVAYESLPTTRRREIHAKIASALQRADAGDRIEAFDRIARHASLGQLWDDAARHLAICTKIALERSAYDEANGFLDRYFGALDELPPNENVGRRRIDALLQRRMACFATGQLDVIPGVLKEAEVLADSIGDERRRCASLIFQANIHGHLGEPKRALPPSRQAHGIAIALQHAGLIASSSIVLGLLYEILGRGRRILEVLEPVVEDVMDAASDDYAATTALQSVQCMSVRVVGYAMTGQFEKGCAVAEAAFHSASDRQRPYDLAIVNYYWGTLLLEAGRVDDAIPILERGLGCSQPFNAPWLWHRLGHAHILAGELVNGQSLLRRGLAVAEKMRLRTLIVRSHLSLALAEYRAGVPDAAKRLATDAMQLARHHGYAQIESGAMRLLAAVDMEFGSAKRSATVIETVLDARAIADRCGLEPERAHCNALLGAALRQAERAAEARSADAEAIAAYDSMGVDASRISQMSYVRTDGPRTPDTQGVRGPHVDSTQTSAEPRDGEVQGTEMHAE